MSLEELGILAEMFGALAILVTLIYLAIQVKDGARASRSAAVTDATTAMQSFYEQLGSNREASDLFLHGLRDPEALPEDRRFQFLMLMHSCFLGFQRSYFLAREGTLDLELRDSIGTAIEAVNHLPGMHMYWRQRRRFFQDEFVSWVEKLLEKPSASEMDAYRSLLRSSESTTSRSQD
jgi:hypothetical protein